MPLLEELETIPTEKYARGAEIFAHAQAIGRHYDLYDNACFQTKVTELRWDEETSRWTIFTDRDDRIAAHFVCMANGPLNRPKLPGIPGVQSFAGHMFHTSRWDYEYTGGGVSGNLTGLADKRVGIIGTGATAVQCVSRVGASAKHLYVFQRTPSSVDVRANRPTDPEFIKSLKPGWQQRRMNNFNILVGGGYQEEDLVGDGWTEIMRLITGIMNARSGNGGLSPEELVAEAELIDFQKMEQVRARVASIVEDPETAEALKPYYRQFCKRPCFDDEYLPTFNRKNVTLVDTQGRGVDRIARNMVVAGGAEYEVDCLIFATGFEVGTSYWRRAGYDVRGRNGRPLSEKWSGGLSTFQGFLTGGFPNCFFMMGFQSGLPPNLVHAINEQSKHVAHLIGHAVAKGVTTVECKEDAEAEWVRMIHESKSNSLHFQKDCTPSYLNNEGKPDEGDGWFGGYYGEGPEAYFQLLRDWRAAGTFEGIEFT